MTVANQAALFSHASLFATPSARRGNLFAPFSLRYVFEAARTGMKTVIFALFCDSAPFLFMV
jgi:hypothetical protein